MVVFLSALVFVFSCEFYFLFSFFLSYLFFFSFLLMPYYRRGYRRRFRLGRRYRRRLYRRSYARRYINGSSRSSIRMKCVQTFSNSANSGYAGTLGPVETIRPYDGNNAQAVVLNPLYQAYRALYEETKLIGMKVQLNVTSVVGNATLPSLEIYTAWDRRNGRGEAAPTANDVKAMATSSIATALNNNVAKITRSIYASDLMEKAQWHDSEERSAADQTDDAWYVSGKNPNFFCPAFFFCFGSPSLAAPGTTVGYSVSVTYYVAFRNPKYGGSASSKDLPARSVTFAGDDDDDDEDMDDGAFQRDMARLDEFRYVPDAPAAAAAAADAPAPLERRQRSAASQAAGDRPPRQKKNV